MIIEKFEGRVKADPASIAVRSGETAVTYGELNGFANRLARVILSRYPEQEQGKVGQIKTVGLLLEHGHRQIVGLLAVLKARMTYVPLDSNYPEKRLVKLITDAGMRIMVVGEENIPLAGKLAAAAWETGGAVVRVIPVAEMNNPGFSPDNLDWEEADPGDRPAYLLYTSGSGGESRGVIQTCENVCYYAESCIRLLSITDEDRLSYLSSFVHDGAVPDIYGALLSGAALCPLDLRARFGVESVGKFLMAERITIYHSVPTVFRYVAAALEEHMVFPHLRYIMTGGEKLQVNDVLLARKWFPGVIMGNIYGQTESTVNSIGFIDPARDIERITIGNPLEGVGLMVLNERGEQVEPYEIGEIFVVCPHLALGYWRDSEATARAFLYEEELGRVYRTGDLGKLGIDGSIEFVGRKDRQVKIRGFRVELQEIEGLLLAHEQIKEAVVVLKENQTGEEYLCAYIVPAAAADGVSGESGRPGVMALRVYLEKQLPDYMIPAHFQFLEKMPRTATGKVNPRALPEPEISSGESFIAPRDSLEEQLVEIWSGVLKVSRETIGIDANFFNLGGHSLRATVLISRIHKRMNVRVPLREIFNRPTIRELARYIHGAGQEEFISIEAAEEREYYALTPTQQRFYVLQHLTPGSLAFNMTNLIPLAEDADLKKIEQTFKQLIQRHEALRTSFEIVNGEPVQRIHDEVGFEIEYLAAKNAKDREEIIKNFIRPFDLSKAPLLRVELIRSEQEQDILMVDMHHLISDGSSHQVLYRDFAALYAGEEQPPLRLQYRDFSQWLNRVIPSAEMKKHEEYWLNRLQGKLPLLELPTDYPRPAARRFEGARYSITLGTQLTEEINRLIRKTGTTLYMVLLSAFNILLSRYTGQQDILVGSPIAGRYHADLENIIGLVIGGLVMCNYPAPLKTYREFLTEVKTNTLEAYEHQAYPLEELIKKIDWEERPGHDHIIDVALILQNIIDAPAVGQPVKGTHVPATSKLDVTLYVMEYGQAGDIEFMFEYCTALFKPQTIERMAGHFISILREVVKDPQVILADIDMIGFEEKVRVIGSTPPLYPLTHPQKRFYYAEKVFPGIGYNTALFTVRYKEISDRELLGQAINMVLRKNEGMRLRIVEFEFQREPLQYIAPYTPFSLEEKSRQWIEQDFLKPPQMINSPLYYFAYTRFDEKESGFYMKLHHIITDGRSVILTFNEITAVYEALKDGKAVDDSLNPSYLRFLSYEKEYLRSTQAEKDRAFWHRYLLPLPEKIRLTKHADDARMKDPAIRGKVLTFPGEVRSKLHRCRKDRGISIFKSILSALSIYISRVTGADEAVIAAANHNRCEDEHWDIIGTFVSMFPLRIKTGENLPFWVFVERTGEEINYILKNHQRYPFDLMLEELRQKTGVDPVYLLDITLLGHPDIREARYKHERHFPSHDPSPLTIHINISNRDIHGVLELQWHYQPHIFSEEDIGQIHRCLVNILDDALSHPEKQLREIELLSAEEKEMILYRFNDTVLEGHASQDKLVHRLFEEEAGKVPDRIAVVSNGQQLNYRELNLRADRLAGVLREKGVLADDIIGIMVEPSIGMVIGILGILKAGAAYLPIDPEYPRERIDYMLKDSGVEIFLTGNELSLLSSVPEALFNLSEGHRFDLAYIIYTSGSTGRPKGVMVTHGNLMAYLNAFENEFDLRSSDVVIQQASFAFDAFVEELYPVLLKGGRLAIPQRHEVRDVELLVEYIRRQNITMITCSPLLLSELSRRAAGGTIRIFISGGDRLKAGYINRLVELEKAVVYNTYGPTEGTVCASYYRCHADDPSNVPIGKPIANYKLYITDRYGHILPVGVAGELCISGPGVARGYLNRPELTAEKFVYYRSYRTYRTYSSYRTGDLMCWLPDGNIEFLGRMDRQVKIRGYRIELGEIENRLNDHPAVKESVAVDTKDASGDVYLCAYIVPFSGMEGEGFEPSGLREYLSDLLPGYMVPSRFVVLEKIPLTAGGKVDVRALSGPDAVGGRGYAAPRNELEKKLEEIWQRVLAIEKEKIGIDANFFELGGHSLKATSMIAVIHKELDVQVPLMELFNAPTIRGLVRYIREANRSRFVSIEPVEKRRFYRLSLAQKRMYILKQIEPDGMGYNIPRVIPVGKDIDRERLEQTFLQLIDRHESLRTSFHDVDGEPVQVIHDDVEFEIEYLAAKNAKDREEILKDFIKAFDLSKAPLLRVGVIESDHGMHLLMADMHHIISDGISMQLLGEDFTALYRGEKLPPLRIRYKDYALWQQEEMQQEAIKQQEAYWVNEFAGEIPRLDLPTDFPRPAIQRFEGRRLGTLLTGGETLRLKELASSLDATLYMVLAGVLNVLLFKLTGSEDIVIGTALAGRRHADLEPVIGMFVNTLAPRNRPLAEKTVKSFLQEVREKTLRAFENQDYPFEELVEKVSVERDLGRTPIFDVMFTLQNMVQQPGLPPPGITSSGSPGDGESWGDFNPIAKFDLTVLGYEIGDRLALTFEYAAALFKQETIQRFIGYFKTVITGMTENPDAPLSDIEIISDEEKQKLLVDFNQAHTDYPRDKTIHELFAEQVERIPDGAAVVGAAPRGRPDTVVQHLTYKELIQKSDQLAFLLREKGVLADSIVGIMMHRSIEMIIGILGILKAGAGYLPIDPEYPEERKQYMLRDSGARILLTNLSEGHPINLPASSPSNLAYIIYTSGTTGRPKGTLITHANVIRVVRNTDYIHITAHDRLLQLSNYAFDGSVFDIYGALLNGAVLVMLKAEEVIDVERLSGIIKKQAITCFFITTALFNTMVDLAIDCLPGVRKVLVGGETASITHMRKALAYLGKDRIMNVYGPTETTVFATYYNIDRVGDKTETIPIGSPIANTSVYILDKAYKPVPVMVSGEIYIGGEGVARGYLNQPELTAEKFFYYRSYRTYRTYSSYRSYRTGDLGRWLPGGNIEFQGRIDHQVKIRGFRIELSEIENRLLTHERIKEVVVTVREDAAGSKHLCAYIVSDNGPSVFELRDFLSAGFPEYMIPSSFIFLEALPLTPNGKIDRGALPAPEAKAYGEYIAPRDEIEKKLAEIWAGILGLEISAVGIDSGFFESGGNSLKATTLKSLIHKELNVVVQLADIFEKPTIRGLGERIRGSEIREYTIIEKVEEKEFYELSYNQRRLWVLHQVDLQNPSYNLTGMLSLNHDVNAGIIRKILSAIIEKHEGFRTYFVMVDGEPVQFVAKKVEIPFAVEDISALPPAERNERRAQIIGRVTRTPFNPGQAPLFRSVLIKDDREMVDFVFSMHHIISDGWSMEILKREFFLLYEKYYDQREPDPEKLEIQYKDFAKWQKAQLKNPALKEKAHCYWQKKLSGELPGLLLPQYVNETYHIAEFAVWGGGLTGEVKDRLDRAAADMGASTFMLFFSGVNVVLAWLSGQKDIICGLLTAGREHAALQNVVGFFVNTLILKSHIDFEEDFHNFLRRTAKDTLEAIQYQGYPLELVFEELKIKYPDIPVMFNMIDIDAPRSAAVQNPGAPYHTEEYTGGKFDISVHVLEYKNGADIRCIYRKRLFTREQMAFLLQQYLDLMEKIAAEPDKKIATYFSSKKKRRLNLG